MEESLQSLYRGGSADNAGKKLAETIEIHGIIGTVRSHLQVISCLVVNRLGKSSQPYQSDARKLLYTQPQRMAMDFT